jgi:hypothetical protein
MIFLFICRYSVTMAQIMEISRLRDGRLFTRKMQGGPKVLQGGEWIDAKGVTVADVWEAKPLRSSDIDTLRAKGNLPN